MIGFPRCRDRRGRLAPVVWLLGLLMATGPAAAATQCLTDKLKYTNKGAYEVTRIGVLWLDGKGEKHERIYDMKNAVGIHGDQLFAGESWSFDVGKNAADLGILQGTEVWLKIYIYSGESHSCRKDEYPLVYDEVSGRTMAFHSSGTTLNNNRCKYSGSLSKDCYTGE